MAKKKSGGGFGGGVGALNKRFNTYQSGEDLDFSSDTHAAIRDRFGREFRREGDQRYAAAMDRFNTGLMPSSIQGVAAGELHEANRNAYNDALLDAYLGIRSQNMGQLTDFGNMEVGNLGSKRSAGATRFAAKQSAGASRYATDANRAIANRNANIAEQQWAWNAQRGLADDAFNDSYGQWSYDQNFDPQALDDYLRRAGGVGGQGSQTTQPFVPINPQTMIGNTMTGIGAMRRG